MSFDFWRNNNNNPRDFENDEAGQRQNTPPIYSSESLEVPIEEPQEEVIDYQVEPADPEKARFYNNISRWAIYVGMFLMPLFFLPWTSNVLEMNKLILLTAVAGTALISWLLGIVSSGYLAWRNNNLDWGILGFLVAFIAATVFSAAKFKGLFGVGAGLSDTLMAATLFTVIYFLLVNNIEDRGKFGRFILGTSLILALVYGLLQLFGISLFKFSFATSRAFNTVGSLNALGILAAVGLPLFSKSRFDVGFLRGFHIEKIGVVLSLVFLILVNWWVLWVVAIAGMVAMIVFENIGGGKLKMKKLILPMTVVVLAVFLIIVKLDFAALRGNLPVEVSLSHGLSLDIVKSVFKENVENILFGYGLESFSVAFDKYGAGKLGGTTLSNVRFFDAASEIMTLLAQGGLVMLAALVFLFWSIGVILWKSRKYFFGDRDREAVEEDIGILSSLLAMVTALFLYPFNLTLWFSFYVFMGLAALLIFDKNKKEFNVEQKTSLSIASSLGFIGGLILVLVGVYFGARIYVGDVRYAQALIETNNEKIANTLVAAINWNNQDDRYYRVASQAALNLLAAELGQKSSPERDSRLQNYIATSISLARKATEIDPREALNWSNSGFIYQNLLSLVDGVDKLSEDAYLKASELRPGDPAFSYRIGLLYMAKFDLLRQLVAAGRANPQNIAQAAQEAVEKSEEKFKEAISISPNFGLAIYNLGVAYDRQGELGEAIEQLEKIIPFNSGNAGLNFELGLLYYRAGRKNDALSQLQRALVLAPDYANAKWYLSFIYEERKDIEAAIKQLEGILNIDVNKDDPVVTKRLEDLKAGKTIIPPQSVLDQKPLR